MKILVFSTFACSGCRTLHTRLDKFFAEHPETKSYVEFIQCEDNDDLVEKYVITAAPTVICIDKSGAPIWRFVGYSNDTDYEKSILSQIRHENDCDEHPQYNRGVKEMEH